MTVSIKALSRVMAQVGSALPRTAVAPRAVMFCAALAASAMAPQEAQAQTADQMRNFETHKGRNIGLGALLGNVAALATNGNRAVGTVLGALAGGLASKTLALNAEEREEAALFGPEPDTGMKPEMHASLRRLLIQAAADRLVMQDLRAKLIDSEATMHMAQAGGEPAHVQAGLKSAFEVNVKNYELSAKLLNARLHPLQQALKAADRGGFGSKVAWRVFDNRLAQPAEVVSTFNHWPEDVQAEVSRVQQIAAARFPSPKNADQDVRPAPVSDASSLVHPAVVSRTAARPGQPAAISPVDAQHRVAAMRAALAASRQAAVSVNMPENSPEEERTFAELASCVDRGGRIQGEKCVMK